MNTKHTPGPWRVNQNVSRHVVGPNGGVVTCCELTFGADVDDANVRLISAAPELLEALKGLDEAYCRAGTPLNRAERHEDRMRLIAARAAIAKATGESDA